MWRSEPYGYYLIGKGVSYMKKVYKLRDLDCANCAAKMEDAVKRIPGVRNVAVSFMSQRLTIEADDEGFDTLMKEVVKTCRRVEPDCTLLL